MNYDDIAGILQTFAMKFQCLTSNEDAYHGRDIEQAINYLDDVIFEAREFKKQLKKELKNG